MSRCYLLLFCTTMCAVLGCGNGMPQTVRVTGTVTFDGQKPPGPGIVYFLPQEPAGDLPLRPATGDFDAEGRYAAMTFEPGDGMIPGKYKVYIECWEQAPNMEGKPVKSFVPKKYQNAETSGIEINLTTDSASREENFNVTTK
ncbi:MAG: hypothetical protein IT423_03910 [Pirellulaceae bacterium]|nr:hypothetical protein [Pirellulaceae bacterium]